MYLILSPLNYTHNGTQFSRTQATKNKLTKTGKKRGKTEQKRILTHKVYWSEANHRFLSMLNTTRSSVGFQVCRSVRRKTNVTKFFSVCAQCGHFVYNQWEQGKHVNMLCTMERQTNSRFEIYI